MGQLAAILCCAAVVVEDDREKDTILQRLRDGDRCLEILDAADRIP